MRRRFLALEQRLERTTTANAALQHDMQKLLEQDAVRRSERKQLGGLIAETKNIMEEVRRAGDRRESEQRMLNDKLVRGVQELKSLVERTEAAAEERHLVGTNLKFRWPGLKKP
ncbi:hypothetical protein EVJ58_g10843 [Rhodofomes roseus]|uniref:Uncharacterized protein n=1 Tax=Rhodofomes roseus TaxID=34475 RepID=A0A4Y9XLF6_9APHY|nr:hypothetical protein EVJ58_g10843 [Rhodofomes roseus]